MKWASALSSEPALGAAVDTLVERLGREFEQVEPDVVLAFAAGHDPGEFGRIARRLRPWAGDALVMGCNSSGAIGGGREEEEGPALALLAGLLTDVELAAIHLEQSTLPPVTAPREAWWQLTGIRPEAEPCFLLLADPFSFDAEHCARGLDRAYPGATVVGGLSAAAAQPGMTRLVAEHDAHTRGALLLACTGNIRVDGIVAQGCRPVGEPLFVTRAEDNRIRELDGRSPRDVIADLYGTLDARDRELFNQRQLFIGLALPRPSQAVGPGDFLVRTIIGLDADSGELMIGARPAVNGVVQFQLRDAGSSAADLAREIGRQVASVPGAPAAAIMLSCVGRGAGLYGVAGHDTAVLQRAFPDTPVGGMFCAGEIGPVQGATFLHGFTTVLGLIRPRRP